MEREAPQEGTTMKTEMAGIAALGMVAAAWLAAPRLLFGEDVTSLNGVRGTAGDELDVRVPINRGMFMPEAWTKVFFPVGSAVISAKGKQDLQNIASQAKAIN